MSMIYQMMLYWKSKQKEQEVQPSANTEASRVNNT